MSGFRHHNVVEIDLCNSDAEDDVALNAVVLKRKDNVVITGKKRSPNSLSDVPVAATPAVNIGISGDCAATSSRGQSSSSAGLPLISSSSSSSSSMPVISKIIGVPSMINGKSTKTFDIDLTSDSVPVVHAPTKPVMYLEIVTNVFPDAKVQYVTKLLDKYMNDVDSVVQDMIANGYEKVEIINVIKAKEFDFRSTSWVTSDTYREVALNALCNDFPFIQRKSIVKIFEKHSYHYYPSLAWLEKELNVERY